MARAIKRLCAGGGVEKKQRVRKDNGLQRQGGEGMGECELGTDNYFFPPSCVY